MATRSKENVKISNNESQDHSFRSIISFDGNFTVREKKIAFVTAVVVIVLLVGGISLQQKVLSSQEISSTDLTARSTGQVALTESELRETVKTLKLKAYWAGSVEGNLYTLDTRGPGQIYIRYLPNGDGLADTSANYRVVGTYQIKDAFVTTQAAGTSVPNSVGFTNGDGAAVYYTKGSPNNVYLAFDGEDLQIEIFDPGVGVALQLALSPTTVSLLG